MGWDKRTICHRGRVKKREIKRYEAIGPPARFDALKHRLIVRRQVGWRVGDVVEAHSCCCPTKVEIGLDAVLDLSR